MSFEADHYEQEAIWSPDHFIEHYESVRLTSCLNVMPKGVLSLLDVGAGNGAFLRIVENGGKIPLTVGVDRSSSAVAASICKSTIRLASAEKLPFADGAFDLVSALAIIEHLPCPTYEKALTEIGRVSKSHVLLSVPYREKRLYVQCPYCGCQFNPYYHVRSFNEGDLEALLPGYVARRYEKIYREESVLKILLHPFRRQAFGGFSDKALCPQCGYRERTSMAGNKSSTWRALIKKVLEASPKIKVPVEIIVLYERVA